jgi:hypothetical protein
MAQFQPHSKKWREVCVHLKEIICPTRNMKMGIGPLLCLPGSNASTETVSSRMNYIWSEEKSRFHVYTMHAILAVKTNIDLSCEAFCEKRAPNPVVLRKLQSLDEHHVIGMTSSSI